MLQRPPTIINDFAANAWALSAADPRHIEVVTGAPIAPATATGSFCIVGVGTGLGVAALIRDSAGHVTVLQTEAGHSELISHDPEFVPVLDIIRRQVPMVYAETVLSAGGLVAIYNVLAIIQGSTLRATNPQDVTAGATNGDPIARKAVALFCKALWSFAGNLALIYGSWDGIFLTGKLVQVLRGALRSVESQARFTITGPYERLLRSVPSAFMTLDHGELRGAAEAIRHIP